MVPTTVFYHPRFLEHDTGNHPETAERLVVTRRALMESSLPLAWVTPEPASVEDIARVHGVDYISYVRQVAEQGGAHLGWDTVISGASYDAALLAAGAGVQAVRDVVKNGRGTAFLLIRPPGHHALHMHGMGFCLFNNVAVAATYALEVLGLERVLIVDWDVHHGNGTQEAFYWDPRVLFVSMHQSHHYPGTGAPDEVGAGPGAGHTINLPLPAGAGDGAVSSFFRSLIEPIVRAFQPQLILISGGFDSRAGDPLGDLRYSPDAYQWMAGRLRSLADEFDAGGPICFLEGGYDAELMAESVIATIKGLQGMPVDFEPKVSANEEKAVLATADALSPYWREIFC